MKTNNPGNSDAIVFDRVAKAYQEAGSFAIFDVSFTVREGELVFICGDSGAGKSTMIKLITGEIRPTRGSVTVNGVKIEKLKDRRVPHFRRTLGVVYQDFRLIQNKTAEENVAFAMRVLGASRPTIRRRVEYVMDLVGLGDKMNSKPGELSGGEQQRVAIARALVNNPSIIIADEPTGNLDPQRSYEIMELLYRINTLGTTVVVITHDYELLRRFAPRVIYMQQGLLAADRVLEPLGPEDKAADEELENPETVEELDGEESPVEASPVEEAVSEEAPIEEAINEEASSEEEPVKTIPFELLENIKEDTEDKPEEPVVMTEADLMRKDEFIPKEEFSILPVEEVPEGFEITREEPEKSSENTSSSLTDDWAKMLDMDDDKEAKA